MGSFLSPLVLSSFVVAADAAAGGGGDVSLATTCQHVKDMYREQECCGNPTQELHVQMVPAPPHFAGANPCAGTKPTGSTWDNILCDGAITNSIEQSGADVTAGYQGQMDVGAVTPLTTAYFTNNLCPVNVHWHLGAEHRSAGQFDETGSASGNYGTPAGSRRLHTNDPNVNLTSSRRLQPYDADDGLRYGYACMNYDASDAKFTTEYNWQHCMDMHVGETYEVHWPHSAVGACGTPNQYQSPFYDGVFCNPGGVDLGTLGQQDVANSIGVQGQVFTIVNDEDYYYPDLIRGMIIDGAMGSDVAAYTGSTTGTSRDNEVCSQYAPITWQVDRTCHLISASTFDKMCADMKQMRDDMSSDLHPHGARELVLTTLAANNFAEADTQEFLR